VCHTLHSLIMATLFQSSYDLPFRGLPRELRDLIYKFAFLSGENTLCFQSRMYSPPLQDDIRIGGLYVRGLTTLFANRQMYLELLEILWNPENKILFSCPTPFINNFLRDSRPTLFGTIRHIVIGPQTIENWSLSKMMPLMVVLREIHHLTNLTLPFYTTEFSSDTDRWPPRPYGQITTFKSLRRVVVSEPFLTIHWVRTEHLTLATGFCDTFDIFMLWRPLDSDHPTIGFRADAPNALYLLSPPAPKIHEFEEAAKRRNISQPAPGDERLELKIYANWEDDDTLVVRKIQPEDDESETIRAMQRLHVRHALLFYLKHRYGSRKERILWKCLT
jgi:hypothetical protein